ncbi:MAG: beta-ketoacyl synthase N-terminal-like domain-containing protein [Bacteroidetes bacterium]|nr:beta-ketoacyl synthase N-terminal-like domain-containing protein [Bacteroidota bacterium]
MTSTKAIYINGLGNVSPQKTTDNSHFLDDVNRVQANRLSCIEPNYREFISPDILRRMGRLIKMSVASSRICLQDAGCAMPDAIITGTGLGCLEDTEKFLTTLIRNKEELLTPTSFIQSTHNTVSAQIALLLKCHNYNFTYVHRGWSFESALIDSLIHLNNGRASNVLAGGFDEITNGSFAITERLGHWRRKPVDTFDLLASSARGSVAGEGSAFFLLSSSFSPGTYAVLADILTFNRKTAGKPLHSILSDFLENSGTKPGEVDLVVSGMNGDSKSGKLYKELTDSLTGAGIAAWKHLSGEYMTSSAFGLWMASMIMKYQNVPEAALMRPQGDRPIRTILIYNHYLDLNHSFILIKKP